ncbi:MAG: S8 family serine peptidase [Verrucomicrobiales bacterium]|nr:S8 family serine peptidase [Verrucomicrobiales bacterium]
MKFSIAVSLILFLSGSPLVAERMARTEGRSEDSVVIILAGNPLSEPAPGSLKTAVAAVGGGRKAALQRQQDEVQRALVALGGTVTARFDTLLNAVVARIPAGQWDAVRSIPGVLSIRREPQYRSLLSSSVPFIGAPTVWSYGGGITGTGIRIAIIDSGIDYLHGDFGGSGDASAYAQNDPTLIEPGTFPTPKVVGGYDFVGDDYDSSGETPGSITVEIPDPDPLDPAQNGHGTHVAGIAAGVGVLTNGVPFPGPYGPALDPSKFRIGPGVAPGALLYAYKVFGRSGSTRFTVVAQALERALDPNQDGDFSDRVDVVNLSLGVPFGVADALDPELGPIRRLAARGVVVVVAAGNSGNTHYICGAPGVAPEAITVANSFDNATTFTTIRVTAPAAVVGDYAASEANFTPRLSEVGPVSAPVVAADPILACDDLTHPGALQGRIALIDRGSCTFVRKIRRAQNAGAVGVLMVNNVDGAPIQMGAQEDFSDIRIPALMISRLDGSILKAQLDAGLSAVFDAFASVARPELADQINESSSRGPGIRGENLKPDLSAPGTSIASAQAGSGAASVSQTGTSMASPHVAGAAALARALHPDWSVEDIKALLMNTAAPVRNDRQVPYPQSRGGAGRIHLEAALRTDAIVRTDSAAGSVSLSFGSFEVSGFQSLTRNVRVVNHGNQAAVFQVTVSNTAPRAGVVVVPSVREIAVAAGGSLLVPIRLELSPDEFARVRDDSTPSLIGDKPRQRLEETGGDLWFLSGDTRLRLPWHVVARATGTHHVTAENVGVPAAESATISLPTRGISAHPQPLVSVFQLGYEGSPGVGDSGNLLAAGVATDFLHAADPGEARVFFGMATAGEWVTPQYELLGLEVEIDTNQDEIAEYILLNSSAGNLNGQGFDADLSNDALMTLVMDTSIPPNFFSAGGVFNVLEPAFRDTAPYHNRVAVLSAPLRSLGLGASNTRFRYRVTTTGLHEIVSTETPWIEFDAAHPLVDATRYGLQGSPLFDEGLDIQADIHRNDALALGWGDANPLKVLMLHQHSVAGQQVDRVTLRLDTPDSDGDGLSDDWELRWFSDLAPSGDQDTDQDGVPNSAEALAGTNPADVRLQPPDRNSGTIHWNGIAGRRYSVEVSTTLGGPYAPRLRHLDGAEGERGISISDWPEAAATLFLRISPE